MGLVKVFVIVVVGSFLFLFLRFVLWIRLRKIIYYKLGDVGNFKLIFKYGGVMDIFIVYKGIF